MSLNEKKIEEMQRDCKIQTQIKNKIIDKFTRYVENLLLGRPMPHRLEYKDFIFDIIPIGRGSMKMENKLIKILFSYDMTTSYGFMYLDFQQRRIGYRLEN